MGTVRSAGRVVGVVGAALLTACALSSCGSSPPHQLKKVAHSGATTSTTSTTTTTTTSSTTSTTPLPVFVPATAPQVAVPNVIGLKIAPARAALRAATLAAVSLNTPCNKGTTASQSVVASLSTPGPTTDPRVGAQPLRPGALVAAKSSVGITWSGCFGGASSVPSVLGLSLPGARQALHAAGLTWACYSVAQPTTTTSSTTTSSTNASTTSSAVTTTTAKPPQVVLTQDPAPGSVVHPGSTVSLTMQHCPQ
jgi:beta-lactam-binding protein with PASTA domain